MLQKTQMSSFTQSLYDYAQDFIQESAVGAGESFYGAVKYNIGGRILLLSISLLTHAEAVVKVVGICFYTLQSMHDASIEPRLVTLREEALQAYSVSVYAMFACIKLDTFAKEEVISLLDPSIEKIEKLVKENQTLKIKLQVQIKETEHIRQLLEADQKHLVAITQQYETQIKLLAEHSQTKDNEFHAYRAQLHEKMGIIKEIAKNYFQNQAEIYKQLADDGNELANQAAELQSITEGLLKLESLNEVLISIEKGCKIADSLAQGLDYVNLNKDSPVSNDGNKSPYFSKGSDSGDDLIVITDDEIEQKANG